MTGGIIDRFRTMAIARGRLIYDGTVEELRSAYGTTRVLVVDLVEDEPVAVSGATVARAEGGGGWSSPATR